jgi:hypothetical protein
MRDAILAKLIGKKLVKGPNRWTDAGLDFIEDHAPLEVGSSFKPVKPTEYAEKLAEQIKQLFGPSARIVVDSDPEKTSKILANLAAKEQE